MSRRDCLQYRSFQLKYCSIAKLVKEKLGCTQMRVDAELLRRVVELSRSPMLIGFRELQAVGHRWPRFTRSLRKRAVAQSDSWTVTDRKFMFLLRCVQVLFRARNACKSALNEMSKHSQASSNRTTKLTHAPRAHGHHGWQGGAACMPTARLVLICFEPD